MNKASLLVPIGILFTVSGCSGNSQNGVSNSAPAVVQASVVPASKSPVAEPAAALPTPSVGQANQHAWHSENVADTLGKAIALKGTSLDGKFDLVVLERGNHPFLAFARHARWESLSQKAAQGKLMYLRVKFEDGQEKHVEWDELGSATENMYGVLWSYPAKTDTPIGPAIGGAAPDSVGGDQLLLQDMMKHKTMLLEVAPGVTTQFDITGLAHEVQKIRAPESQPILEASQSAE
jgi:hypothetical protein